MSTWSNNSKNSASWTNQSRSTASLEFLLMESGDRLLLESGDRIALEQGGIVVWTNITKN